MNFLCMVVGCVYSVVLSYLGACCVIVELFLKFGYFKQVVCTEGPDIIRELIAMGASFDHGEDGNLHLAGEGGALSSQNCSCC
jgi:hypothetical protein